MPKPDLPPKILNESDVPEYQLPDLLTADDGTRIADAEAWRKFRRPQILEKFEQHVYGRPLPLPEKMEFEQVDLDRKALGGLATRKQVVMHFANNGQCASAELLIYLPNGAPRPTPVFLGHTFYGNHTVHSDPDISLSETWMRDNPEFGVVNHRATEASRGVRTDRWPVETILERGYGLATLYYGDFAPDHKLKFRQGALRLFQDTKRARRMDECGAIGAWAWGLSRALDCLEKDRMVDKRRVAVIGHSRLGKTALWAGACDERFAIVISNDSGCGGAALSRRRFGETVLRINTHFPHWFCPRFRRYNEKEYELPVDQHMLVALAAPRPAYVASATEDLHADPRGEFLSALHAAPAYQLFGKEGLPAKDMPPPDQPVHGDVGYHVRTGGHGLTAQDWAGYLDFADRQWGDLVI